MYCESLKSIVIPNSVAVIGEYTFTYCTSLELIVIPDSITEIGKYAFRKCTSLKDVYYSGTADDWDNIRIDDDNELLLSANIHYTSNVNESYKFRFKRAYNE